MNGTPQTVYFIVVLRQPSCEMTLGSWGDEGVGDEWLQAARVSAGYVALQGSAHRCSIGSRERNRISYPPLDSVVGPEPGSRVL